MNRPLGTHKASTRFCHSRIRSGCCAAGLIVLFACLPSSNLCAEDLGGSNLLQQASALCQQSFRNLSNSNRQENFASFRRLLPALAATEEKVRASTPEEKTLLKVARAAGAHPALLDELVEYYGHWHGTRVEQPQVLRPAPLQATHLTEKYRPAWEALLLAPPSVAIEFMSLRAIITEAISRIGNEQSIPVLELAFFFTCEAGVVATERSGAATRRLQILVCLNQTTTRESLEVMFRCLARAEAASAGQLPKDAYGRDLRDWIVRFLTDQDNYRTKERWSQVLKTFPKDNLPANQRELLERAVRQQ